MNIEDELLALKNSEKAIHLQRFFKTDKGQYGYGDIFLGINVPDQRKIAKKHEDLKLSEIQKLLNSKYHEFRLTGLIILVEQYKKLKKNSEKKKYFDFYTKNYNSINNWDLVDVTCHHIIGNYLIEVKEGDFSFLKAWAKSNHLWKKRIAIVSTYAFIKKDSLEAVLAISDILINDDHDLIQKAVGWMLRELGKRDQDLLELYLERHHQTMPRTCLRYAIEKLNKNKRDYFMGRVIKNFH